MGSMITLAVGNLEIDWSKNWLGRDHSKLFLASDEVSVPYYYADEIVEQKPAFSRRLSAIRRRLGLLGYSLPSIRESYDRDAKSYPGYYPPLTVGFDQFANAIAAVDATRFKGNHEGEFIDPVNYDPGEYVSQEVFQSAEFNKVLSLRDLSREAGTFFENLDPYITLRLLLENPSNHDAPVIWRFADVLEGGWVEAADVRPGLEDSERYLVVTEGSSDAQILSSAAQLVAPDIADFFYFIDMSDNYPFTGAGNVLRFCQGLAKIRIQNRVLVVLDNDAAGCETLGRLSELSLPTNMKVAKLPDLEDCRSFPTIGPSGRALSDINGQAVSAEMFLDLTKVSKPEPVVRWTSFNDRLNRYQGELVGKVRHTKEFLKARRARDYDLRKLTHLWDSLYAACTGEVAQPEPPKGAVA